MFVCVYVLVMLLQAIFALFLYLTAIGLTWLDMMLRQLSRNWTQLYIHVHGENNLVLLCTIPLANTASVSHAMDDIIKLSVAIFKVNEP